MSKLFRITLRWLKRDKKRTLLAMLGITLAVYVITFVGVYFSSAVSGYRSVVEFEHGNYHSSVYCDTHEQATQISKNVTVKQSAVVSENCNLFYDTFVRDYGNKSTGESNDYFLDLEINGTDVPKAMQCEDISAVAVHGDYFTLYKYQADQKITGRLPNKAGEVALNSYFASLFPSTEIGDTITVTYNVKTGTVYYSDMNQYDELTDTAPTVTDTDGSFINEIYQDLYNESKVDWTGNGSYKIFCQSISFLNASSEEEYGEYYYSDISDNVVESFTYTAKVVGIYSGLKDYMIFSDEDEKIMPFFENPLAGSHKIYLRIKNGIDAQTATVNATKSAGVHMANVGENIEIHGKQLVLEGRSFENLEQVYLLIIASILLISLFVFLARLIINNAFEISSSYRTEQYGALKTIGASDGQLFTMVFFECAVYSVIAVPVGVVLAVISGKFVVNKVLTYKIFDGVYGDGVTETFLNLDINPYILGVIIFIALFSIFFSVLGDALRVKRMSPIKSTCYSKGKSRKKKHRKWLSRRLFGFEFGYAIKSVSRNKTRFAVTVLATVMSGILFVAVTTIVTGYKSTFVYSDPHTYDLELWIDNNSDSNVGSIYDVYNDLKNSGYFSEVSVNGSAVYVACDSEYADDDFYSNFTEEYKTHSGETNSTLFYEELAIIPISREGYEHIQTDISYDELLESNKVLLCNNLGEYFVSNEITAEYQQRTDSGDILYQDPEGSVFGFKSTYNIWNNSSPKTLHYKASITLNDGTQEVYDTPIESAGTYTTDDYNYIGQGVPTAIIPIENIEDFFNNQTGKQLYPEQFEDKYTGYNFLLNVSGNTAKAKEYLSNTYHYSGGITDNSRNTKVKDNLINAIKTAGFALSGVLIAVAALSIVSTMSAQMLNRRKELSMMRSCGMSLRQIFKSLTIEGLFYSVISALISGLAGWKISALILTIMDIEISSFPLLSATLAVFAVTEILVTVSITVPLMKIPSSSIADDIRTE